MPNFIKMWGASQGHDQVPVQIKKLSDNATMPTRGSQFAAGHDLHSAVNAVVPAGGKLLVPTDLSFAIMNRNYYARIAPRSGLALKNHIDVGAGVVDCDYRGPVGVVLFNHSPDTDFVISKGDRIAQVIFERIGNVQFTEVDELSDTVRGAGGFGSTGTGGVTGTAGGESKN
jgi:dUTP pyrophosphatase